MAWIGVGLSCSWVRVGFNIGVCQRGGFQLWVAKKIAKKKYEQKIAKKIAPLLWML